MGLSRLVTVLAGCVVVVGLGACSATSTPDDDDTKAPTSKLDRVDLLIRGGTIYDGVHTAAMTGDVGVVGDRIVFVGAAPKGIEATKVIDATGKVVAPGFIDAHSHVDADVLSDDPDKRLNAAFVTQGVTTAVIGNDGFGPTDIAARASKIGAHPPGTNVAMFVGFGPIRQSQLGDEDAAPSVAQLDTMKSMVADAMCQGAIGLSTGLYYTPQNFSDTNEVVALAKVAARYGGVYDSHLRDEQTPDGLIAAVKEAIQIGERADIPVHIAHIKALGADAIGKSAEIIDLVETAQADGIDVTADQYPWLASSTMLSAALVPPWANAGGAEARLARLNDPDVRSRLRSDIAENLRRRNGPDSVLIAAGRTDLVGKTLTEIATAKGVDPVDAVIAILRDGDVLIANFNQSEDDVEAFMQQPWVGTSSDSSPGHPRSSGSFAQKYREYVVDNKVLTLGEFIRSSTSVNADAYRLADRGRLEASKFADIVVFDPMRFRANATYIDPAALSEGIVATIVNGKPIVENDKLTTSPAGRALLHVPPVGRQPAGRCSDGSE